MIVFIAFNHLYLAVIRTWRAPLPRGDLQTLLIVTQRDLAIAQLRVIRRKQKHTFLYHCLLLCDCSRALIRAQEYISLSFFPNDKKCTGSVQFGEKCTGLVFFSRKTPTPKLRLFKVYYERRLEIRTWNEGVRMCVYLLFSLITLSLLSSN